MIDIKRCIEEFKPEGFGYGTFAGYPKIIYKNCDYQKNYEITDLSWIYDKYGDFLQRVIEGINLKSFNAGSAVFKYRIYQDIDCFRVRDQLNHIQLAEFYFSAKGTIDQAKEQAIQYILNKLPL